MIKKKNNVEQASSLLNDVEQASSLSFIPVRVRSSLSILLILAIFAICEVRSFAISADEILKETGIKGGLVVHLGCGDGKLTSALYANKSYLVHGLDSNFANIAKAREYIKSKNIYGKVSVEHWNKNFLPYTDNLVNLLVSENLADISQDEIMRVLAPYGVAYVKTDGKWNKTIKPYPKEMDEWTHSLYNPSNNAVSSDTIVASPKSLQWTCGPEYARSHEHFSSVSAMVSAHGRVFYIIDEGPISSVFFKPQWKLVARDAFNGVLLWEKPILNWESQLRGFRSGPAEIGRRLVAHGNSVYVTLGYSEPVVELDAATGEKRNVFNGTEGTSEIIYSKGMLYLLADDLTITEHNNRKKWIEENAPHHGYKFPKEAISMYGKQRILAVNTKTKEILWTKKWDNIGEVMPTTMAIEKDKMCVQSVSHIICFDINSGKELWKVERLIARNRWSWSTPSLVINNGVVLSVDRMSDNNALGKLPERKGSQWIMDNNHQNKNKKCEVIVYNIATGKELWKSSCFENYDVPTDIFVINNIVWIGDLQGQKAPGFTVGLDLKTGKQAMELKKNLYSFRMGHHRCYRNKATVNYLLVGRDGIEFVDIANNKGIGNSWVRGACQYGIMPANGLVYAPQHSCACHATEKLNGFNALKSDISKQSEKFKSEQLEKGEAFKLDSLVLNKNEWTTYRGDVERRGFQDLPVPKDIEISWNTKFNSKITAPIIANKKVFIAEIAKHTVFALNSNNGEKLWSFVAGGRVDSPPTYCAGLIVFGCRDGWVYCLKENDGSLVWRFRATETNTKIFSYGQLESSHPIHGSVLINNNIVYFAAGRSSYLDNGIYLYGLDLITGEILSKYEMNTEQIKGKDFKGIHSGSLPDILSAKNDSVFMKHIHFNKKLELQTTPQVHLHAPGGFLDNTWWHRTYWMYGEETTSGWSSWGTAGNEVPAGRLLVLDNGDTIYGYSRMKYSAGGGHSHTDATKDYKLCAESLNSKITKQKRGKKEVVKKTRNIKWSVNLPFIAKSLVLANDALLIAGSKSLIKDSTQENESGYFWIVSREDGTKIMEFKIPASPILDGMAFTNSGIFISTVNNSIICLKNKE